MNNELFVNVKKIELMFNNKIQTAWYLSKIKEILTWFPFLSQGYY